MRKSIRAALSFGAVAALTAGTAAASAQTTSSPVYGPTVVRSGVPLFTPQFTLTSPQLANGAFPADEWWNSFGCTGANQPPTFAWSGAPSTAKSFAITMFDPEATTGSGFWHMVDWDIPATATSFNPAAPGSALVGANDAGDIGYMGPCPPVGDIPHHYVIKVLALDTATLGVPGGMPPALMNYLFSTHIVGVAQLSVAAQR